MKQQLGWAEKLDRQRVEQALAIAEMLEKDSKGFRERLDEVLSQSEMTMPSPDFQDERGNKFFSADSFMKALGVLENKLRNEFQGIVQPLTAEQQARQEREQQAQQQEAQRAEFREAYEHAQANPLFKENEKAISEVMAQIPRELVERRGLVWAMHHAFTTFVKDNWASLQVKQETAVRDGLKRAAAAASGNVTPNGNSATPAPKAPRNADELANRMAQMYAEQGG